MRYLLVLIVLLEGCAASVEETYRADGQQAFSLNCSGWGRNWDTCHRKAGELCGGRLYTIFDRIDGAHNHYTGGHPRTMTIRCR